MSVLSVLVRYLPSYSISNLHVKLRVIAKYLIVTATVSHFTSICRRINELLQIPVAPFQKNPIGNDTLAPATFVLSVSVGFCISYTIFALMDMASSGTLREFPPPGQNISGNPSIAIYNASTCVLQVQDDYFDNFLRLSPGEGAVLGWDNEGMTVVKIEARDHQDRLLKKVTFRSWTGWSWIATDEVIKRQRYGGALSEEEPNGDSFPWSENLQNYYQQRDAQQQIEFQRVIEEMREAARTQGVNVDAQPVDADEDNGEVKSLVCKVCWTNKSRILFEPCGHLVTCIDCSNHLTDCCICRQHILKKHRAFF